MITDDGVAKIVDFGLAKLAGQIRLTRAGTTIGTLAYMSPEQTRGDAVDHHTDIWSLGVVIYEMLTGRLPFRGEETQGAVYSILNKDPEPLLSLLPDIPRHIEQAVAKALAKDPARRYQSVQEFIQDMKAPAPFIFPKPEKSIVVLPFEDMSPDKDNEYFCDGMTEEIITDLSHVHDLLVISRSSTMTFKSTKKTIPEIARAHIIILTNILIGILIFFSSQVPNLASRGLMSAALPTTAATARAGPSSMSPFFGLSVNGC
jgi:non-specific serine/threonine protein kinase